MTKSSTLATKGALGIPRGFVKLRNKRNHMNVSYVASLSWLSAITPTALVLNVENAVRRIGADRFDF